MRNTQIKQLLQLQSMDMFTSYGHIKSQNKITDFSMILAWLFLFKSMYYTSNGLTFELYNIFKIYNHANMAND